MSTEAPRQYPDLAQARVQAMHAARNVLVARTPLANGSVAPRDVIVLADWLLATGLDADPVEPVDHLAQLVAAVTDAYVGPDPDEPEAQSRARMAKVAQRAAAWLYQRGIPVPDWQWRAQQADLGEAPEEDR
jgi:hypothetical protein